MITLKRQLASINVFLFVVVLFVVPIGAHAQGGGQAYGGSAQSYSCVSQVVDYEDSGSDDGYAVDVEQTACFSYSNSYGIDSYVETDDDYYETFFDEYWFDDVTVYGVGAEAQILGYDTNYYNPAVVADSGMVDSNWTTEGQSSASAEASTSVPLQYPTYILQAFYTEARPYFDWGASTGVTLELSFSPIPTPTVVLSTSATPAATGQPITFTASVSNGATGEVGFYIVPSGGTELIQTNGSLPFSAINGTTATYTTGSQLQVPAGTYTVTARYGGDNNNAASSSNSITQIVTNGSLTTTVTSLNPSSGNPGLAVNISGSGFGVSEGQGTVMFSGVSAGVLYWSDSSITAIVPSNATTGPVVVTLANGITSNNNVVFTVGNPSCLQ